MVKAAMAASNSGAGDESEAKQLHWRATAAMLDGVAGYSQLRTPRLVDRIYFYCGCPGFLSGAHGGDDTGYTLDAIRKAVAALKIEGMLAAGGG